MSDIENAVQPKRWYEALPRPGYAALERVPVKSDWFEVYRLPGNVFALYEPHHFQEVISFLILGGEKALLLDTGLGFCDIKAVVAELTSLPLLVVNTHTHFDHIGGNWQFDFVHVINEPTATARLTIGVPRPGEYTSETDENFEEAAFDPCCEIPIDLAAFATKPSCFKTIEEGAVFDLGGRTFRVVHTPGHSPDSIMLANDAEKMLFTGDTVYPASLYAHLQKADGLDSQEDVYRRTLHRVSEEFSSYQLYCSHNEPLRPGAMLVQVADAFDKIAEGTAPFAVDQEGLKKYQFDGFAVITR